jgi:hypothetical protein
VKVETSIVDRAKSGVPAGLVVHSAGVGGLARAQV